MRKSTVALLALALTLLTALAACGKDEEAPAAAGGQGAGAGNPTEKAFLEAMLPHHESAVEMTEVAARRAEAPEIKEISAGISSTQTPEIEQMKSIHQRLFGAPLVARPRRTRISA